ncbi:hypothetical protein AC812_05645 [Bellilinea caldifistulae]|uniref:Uncharacterized protein n=1 Tax=Bellilinea caldifistulae TaxID=360411 RepID=A0A0P6XTZ2_9CHLR|nr:hypothetical protein AC812_05645 [Bellilinea caldifistulae]
MKLIGLKKKPAEKQKTAEQAARRIGDHAGLTATVWFCWRKFPVSSQAAAEISPASDTRK